jgi:hypothetical protein
VHTRNLSAVAAQLSAAHSQDATSLISYALFQSLLSLLCHGNSAISLTIAQPVVDANHQHSTHSQAKEIAAVKSGGELQLLRQFCLDTLNVQKHPLQLRYSKCVEYQKLAVWPHGVILAMYL